ncbi:Histidine--tRNA ligase (chromatophore) [Paulinella micropora]|uniref:histidine--tRNA ligase n=1 Tax=Paulinella micropora TaxID=1928728 RepID=A0A1L5YB72_9EUKA|nr:histidyl-tRNA synthetase [Paulinella micropora]APP87955.1 histidyl-tRNA synthetase [Paulinella micropora]AQX44722.1 histidyl-tRNA synthetase [Paulinella micropora]AXY63113.1 histidyl-tRNA synthetase [Paulinella micropora]BBL85934.1 Histidine--tRNA ligase [Paulinella micropora]
MALQPAAGARDLKPHQIELNHQLCNQLATIYRLWGYQEVRPPKIERLSTLLAGGAIEPRSVIQIVAAEALGLRPEMTASIVRTACSRIVKTNPLRLWSAGTTFHSQVDANGGLKVEEVLQSGVEIVGEHNSSADMELLHLLMAAISALPLEPEHNPRLLIGHHQITSDLLDRLPSEYRIGARDVLTSFDPLAIEGLGLSKEDSEWLDKVLRMRGEPAELLEQLKDLIGPTPILLEVERLFKSIIPRAKEAGISIQLDPSFVPHLDLYNGLVFQLICTGRAAPVIIANGGRYDGLVEQVGASKKDAAGIGFSFAIEEIRELVFPEGGQFITAGPILITYSNAVKIEEAFEYQRRLHKQGIPAEVNFKPCGSRQEAESIAYNRGAVSVEWLDT